MLAMRRWQPVESDFKVEVFAEDRGTLLADEKRLHLARLNTEREIAEFGPLSPDEVEPHPTRSGVRAYNAGDVRAMASRFATAAVRP